MCKLIACILAVTVTVDALRLAQTTGNEFRTRDPFEPSYSEHEPISTDCETIGSNADKVLATTHVDTSHDKDVKVICAVYTYHRNRRQLLESYQTWGKDCNTFLAYSDEEWLIDSSKTLLTIPLRKGLSNYTDLWQSVQLMWKDLANKFDAGELKADYITFSGDDALFVMPNLRAYLSTLPPMSSHNTFPTKKDQTLDFNQINANGYELIGGINEAYRRSGVCDGCWVMGAGYVVSKKTISDRLLDKCDKGARKFKSAAEDVFTSWCLFEAGVVPRDTRDEEGKYRFCLRGPGKSCDRTSLEDPSQYPILFHYMEGEPRQKVHQRFVQCAGL